MISKSFNYDDFKYLDMIFEQITITRKYLKL